VNAVPAPAPAAPEWGPATGTLKAPLYVAWQLTNECNLACLHCIEESGPGKAFADELSGDDAFTVLRQLVEGDVPYMSFSGGEPMLHPRFFELAEYACANGVQLKIETNGMFLDAESCGRLKAMGVKAVQVSLDGATRETFNRMRVRGDFDRTISGIKALREACVPIEINYSPSSWGVHETDRAVDLAYELGAESFYSGRTMYTGNAVKTWQKLTPDEAQYSAMFDLLRAKQQEYAGRMRVHFHEMGLLDELRYRLENPAALLILLPNGLVKLINALPFICGDLRKDRLEDVWANFQRAWKDPRVAQYADALEQNPQVTATLHKWVFV
jgi:MoaA/NifB/PqqE/SkfB family radical SAM enzyme